MSNIWRIWAKSLGEKVGDTDTQAESRVVANQISKVMGKLYPASWDALTDNEGE